MTPTTLWPNTPVANIQAEIWRRCGASDWNMADPNSRPALLADTLQEMVANGLIPERFHLLDIFCGDGVILWQMRKRFSLAKLWGLDLRQYPTHEQASNVGVTFIYQDVRRFIEADQAVDVAVMLNTFRGWDRSGCEADLPGRVLTWLQRNARFVIVTATEAQIAMLKDAGWWVWDIGPGEDDSDMVGMFWSGIK